ncbi:MAG: hypothetical protein ABIH92_02825, partial [Nanoarchaeota archaeon]
DKMEKAFNSLDEGDWLKKAIRKAINELKSNIFCGERIPRKQIPKEYVQKYGVDNLWWYSLPDAWRLVYSVVTPSNVEILAVILEYFDHKNYERRFGY